MNPVQKLWASVQLKWRLRHPIKGIIKPLICEFWRQTKGAAIEVARLIGHAAHAVRSVIRIAFSWPGVLVLVTTGWWAWGLGHIQGMSFFGLLLVILAIQLLKDVSSFIATKWGNVNVR